MSAPPNLRHTTYSTSCDFCESQEGRHYCMLHSVPVKNMDIVKCDDWKDKGNSDLRPTPAPPISETDARGV